VTAARAAAGGGRLPGQVRIIGGRYKRTPVPVAQRPGLRPTPDRVRETLFNWLGQDLTGWHVIDAFAGTGVLGLEAVSRGASRVQAFEQDAELVRRIEAMRDKLQAQALSVVRGDGLSLLRGAPPASTQLVLLDPPFEANLWAPALQAAAQALADPGYIYLEANRAWRDEDGLLDLGLQVHHQGKAGAVHFHLIGRRQPA
jgi:16S rRNA (guanine(966)-N(2))-methyltransferase RsmD